MTNNTCDHQKSIVFIINTFGRGGAEMSLALLAAELVKRGYNVTYVSLWKSKIPYDFDWLMSKGVNLVVFESDKSNFFIVLLKLFKLLLEDRPALIYSAMLYSNFISQICSIPLKIDHISSVRINPARYYKKNIVKQLAFLAVMLVQTKIVFISQRSLLDYIGSKYGQFIKFKKLYVLHNPIENDVFQKKDQISKKLVNTKKSLLELYRGVASHKVSEKRFRIAVISRLVDGKGIIETLEQIKDNMPKFDFKLEIYGEGYLEHKIRNIIAKNFSAGQVELMGYSSNLDIILENTDLLIFPSRNEGFGRVPFEALLSGVLVLCYKPVSIINEFVIDPIMWRDYQDPLDISSELLKFCSIDPDASLNELSNVSVLLSCPRHVENFEKIAFNPPKNPNEYI